MEDVCSISVAGGKVDPQIDDPKDVHRKQSQLQLPVTLILVVFESDETGLEAYVPGNSAEVTARKEQFESQEPRCRNCSKSRTTPYPKG